MTTTARIILQDLKHAISRHDNSLAGEHFRASWFTIVCLLRAIGHVLDKVDSDISEPMKRAISEKWQNLKNSKNENKIFWEFIEPERNRFLKNYKHNVKRTILLSNSSEFSLTIDVGKSQGICLSTEDATESIIAYGPYAGRPEIEVAWEAYHWWRKYLDEIDSYN